MTIASYSIICNEMDFIQDMIEYHSTFLDKMFILDTGSTDGTLEFLLKAAKTNDKLIVEQYHQSFVPEYALDWVDMQNPFPEVEVRNFALDRAEEITGADWILQCDGDEIWLPQTRQILEELGPEVHFLGCSTLNPVVPLATLPVEYRGGFKLYDPHVRAWRSGKGVSYFRNPAYAAHKNPDIHCIPGTKQFPAFHLFHHRPTRFTDQPINFHLHWMHGSKLELYFQRKEINDRQQMIAGQEKNEFSDLLPVRFWQRRLEWLSGEKS